MTEVALPCPYCGAEKTGFALTGNSTPDGIMYVSLARCRSCDRVVMLRFPQGRTRDVKEIIPRVARDKAPLHTPEEVAEAFVEAAEIRRRQVNAAIMSYRRTLDLATQALGANGKLGLKDKIKKAIDDRSQAQTLKDWAEVIRDLGNETTHAVTTREEAKARALELHDFTTLLLTYLFTLPGTLEDRRNGDPE